jgi:hypothetical protein
MKIPRGKTFFIWKVKEVHAGNDDPAGLAKIAKGMGLSAVLVKIANGTDRYNLRPTILGYVDDIVKPLADAFHAQGLEVWGWHYIYGVNPLGEADLGAKRALEMGVDGYIIDAEAEFEQPGMGLKAAQFMDRLRANICSLPVGLSTWRFPSIHQTFCWKEFLPKIDFHLPQVYWVGATNPAEQLTKSLNEYRDLEKTLGIGPLPYVPTGAAYHENGWQPAPEEIKAFHNQVIALGLPGESWWEWGNSIRYGFEDDIAALAWPVTEDETSKRLAQLELITTQLVADVNKNSAQLVEMAVQFNSFLMSDQKICEFIERLQGQINNIDSQLEAEIQNGLLRTNRIKAIEDSLSNISEILRRFGV